MRGREEVEKYQGQHRWYFTQSVAWVPSQGRIGLIHCDGWVAGWSNGKQHPSGFLAVHKKLASDWRSIHWVWDFASMTFSVMFLVIHVMRLHTCSCCWSPFCRLCVSFANLVWNLCAIYIYMHTTQKVNGDVNANMNVSVNNTHAYTDIHHYKSR